MKKIIIFLLLLFTITLYSCNDYNLVYEFSEITDENGLVYIVATSKKDSYSSVSGYIGDNKVVYIPDAFENVKVTKILTNAFNNNKIIEEIYFGSNVATIENDSFSDCSNLKKVVLNDKIEIIPKRCFLRCSNLVDITLSKNLKKIELDAFSNNYLLRNVEFPEGLTTIGKTAFYRTGVRKIILPDSVDSLDYYSFGPCDIYSSKTFDFGVRDHYFYHTSKDEKPVIIEGDKYNFLYVEKDYLYFKGENYILLDYFGNDEKLIIPNSFDYYGKEITNFSLYNIGNHNDFINEIKTSESVNKIVDCFNYCKNLNKVVFSSSVNHLERMVDIYFHVNEIIFEDPYNWCAVDSFGFKHNDFNNVNDPLEKISVGQYLLECYTIEKNY